MSPLYVCFFTTGNGYDAEAMELVKTLDYFGLPSDVIGVPPFGDWTEACQFKPVFLQKMRQKHGSRPLVWLDADARVRQYPRLFLDMPADVDFAAHWKDGEELLSGTMYFGATNAADALIGEWAKQCSERPGEWDQRVLQGIVDGNKTLNVEPLPAGYTAIFDAGMCDPGEVVVEHMQASRRLRR